MGQRILKGKGHVGEKDHYDPETGLDVDFYNELVIAGGFYKRFVDGKICCKQYAEIVNSSLKQYADYLKSRDLPKERFHQAIENADHSKVSRLDKIIGDFASRPPEEIEDGNVYDFIEKLNNLFPEVVVLN